MAGVWSALKRAIGVGNEDESEAVARAAAAKLAASLALPDQFGRGDVMWSTASLGSVLNQARHAYLSTDASGALSTAFGAEVSARATWPAGESVRTAALGLVLCLNIGIDPPDNIRQGACSTLQCWVDPFSMPPQQAIETIGRALYDQYYKWCPKAKPKFKISLDPTLDNVQVLARQLRATAGQERVLMHYNGHGVPAPTAAGEVWVFNQGYTQYMPLSILDLQAWVEQPAMFVFDCPSAGVLLPAFEEEDGGVVGGRDAGQGVGDVGFGTSSSARAASRQGRTPNGTPLQAHRREWLVLAACAGGETLPSSPHMPADLFTACLTDPIRTALRLFLLENPRVLPLSALELLERLPGKVGERQSAVGQLNWVLTAVTDTIAWHVLPRVTFLRLFRQDQVVATLFRNFLFACRVMRRFGCTPQSLPAMPAGVDKHPLWGAWDVVLERLVSLLPLILGLSPEAMAQSNIGLDSVAAVASTQQLELQRAKAEAASKQDAIAAARLRQGMLVAPQGGGGGVTPSSHSTRGGTSSARRGRAPNLPVALEFFDAQLVGFSLWLQHLRACSAGGGSSGAGMALSLPRSVSVPLAQRVAAAGAALAGVMGGHSHGLAGAVPAPWRGLSLALPSWGVHGGGGVGGADGSKRLTAGQLPLLMQAMLTSSRQSVALDLLASFMALGEWAVQEVLSVGVKLYLNVFLKRPASMFRPASAFVWAHLLTSDRDSAKAVLSQDATGTFVKALRRALVLDADAEEGAAVLAVPAHHRQEQGSPGAPPTPPSVPVDHATAALHNIVCLSAIMRDGGKGQSAGLKAGLLTVLEEVFPPAVIESMTLGHGLSGTQAAVDAQVSAGLATEASLDLLDTSAPDTPSSAGQGHGGTDTPSPATTRELGVLLRMWVCILTGEAVVDHCDALGELWSTSLVDAMTACLQDVAPEVRAAAAYGLGCTLRGERVHTLTPHRSASHGSGGGEDAHAGEGDGKGDVGHGRSGGSPPGREAQGDPWANVTLPVYARAAQALGMDHQHQGVSSMAVQLQQQHAMGVWARAVSRMQGGAADGVAQGGLPPLAPSSEFTGSGRSAVHPPPRPPSPPSRTPTMAPGMVGGLSVSTAAAASVGSLAGSWDLRTPHPGGSPHMSPAMSPSDGSVPSLPGQEGQEAGDFLYMGLAVQLAAISTATYTPPAVVYTALHPPFVPIPPLPNWAGTLTAPPSPTHASTSPASQGQLHRRGSTLVSPPGVGGAAAVLRGSSPFMGPSVSPSGAHGRSRLMRSSVFGPEALGAAQNTSFLGGSMPLGGGMREAHPGHLPLSPSREPHLEETDVLDAAIEDAPPEDVFERVLLRGAGFAPAASAAANAAQRGPPAAEGSTGSSRVRLGSRTGSVDPEPVQLAQDTTTSSTASSPTAKHGRKRALGLALRVPSDIVSPPPQPTAGGGVRDWNESATPLSTPRASRDPSYGGVEGAGRGFGPSNSHIAQLLSQTHAGGGAGGLPVSQPLPRPAPVRDPPAVLSVRVAMDLQPPRAARTGARAVDHELAVATCLAGSAADASDMVRREVVCALGRFVCSQPHASAMVVTAGLHWMYIVAHKCSEGVAAVLSPLHARTSPTSQQGSRKGSTGAASWGGGDDDGQGSSRDVSGPREGVARSGGRFSRASTGMSASPAESRHGAGGSGQGGVTWGWWDLFHATFASAQNRWKSHVPGGDRVVKVADLDQHFASLRDVYCLLGPRGMLYYTVWNTLLHLQGDPSPSVSGGAAALVMRITCMVDGELQAAHASLRGMPTPQVRAHLQGGLRSGGGMDIPSASPGGDSTPGRRPGGRRSLPGSGRDAMQFRKGFYRSVGVAGGGAPGMPGQPSSDPAAASACVLLMDTVPWEFGSGLPPPPPLVSVTPDMAAVLTGPISHLGLQSPLYTWALRLFRAAAPRIGPGTPATPPPPSKEATPVTHIPLPPLADLVKWPIARPGTLSLATLTGQGPLDERLALWRTAVLRQKMRQGTALAANAFKLPALVLEAAAVALRARPRARSARPRRSTVISRRGEEAATGAQRPSAARAPSLSGGLPSSPRGVLPGRHGRGPRWLGDTSDEEGPAEGGGGKVGGGGVRHAPATLHSRDSSTPLFTALADGRTDSFSSTSSHSGTLGGGEGGTPAGLPRNSSWLLRSPSGGPITSTPLLAGLPTTRSRPGALQTTPSPSLVGMPPAAEQAGAPPPMYLGPAASQAPVADALAPRLPLPLLATLSKEEVAAAGAFRAKLHQRAILDTGHSVTPNLLWHPTLPLLLATDAGDRVEVWHANTGRRLRAFDNSPPPLGGSAEMRRVLGTPAARQRVPLAHEVAAHVMAGRAGDVGTPSAAASGGVRGRSASVASVASTSSGGGGGGRRDAPGLTPPRPRVARITDMLWLNEHASPLLATASADGRVRVWRDAVPEVAVGTDGGAFLPEPSTGIPEWHMPPKGLFGGHGVPSSESWAAQSMVSSWHAVPDAGRLKGSPRGEGVVLNWQASSGRLLAGGRSPNLRVWDLQREQCVGVASVGSSRGGSVLTAMASPWPGTGVVAVGKSSGSVTVLDMRMPAVSEASNSRLASKLREHKQWVVSLCTPRSGSGFTLISGSVSGEVKFWDMRSSKSVRTLKAHAGPMTACVVHDWAPLLATGSQTQNIRLWRLDGSGVWEGPPPGSDKVFRHGQSSSSREAVSPIASIEFHEGFLGQRIGSIASLAFHPYDMLLASGALDEFVGVYSSAVDSVVSGSVEGDASGGGEGAGAREQRPLSRRRVVSSHLRR